MNNLPSRVFRPPLTGLAAKKAAAEAAALARGETLVIQPATMEHRIGILFDDSSSMNRTQMEDAYVGIEDFLRSCEKDKTAVAVYPLNGQSLRLSSNLPALALLVKNIQSGGGTPLLRRLETMLSETKLTRAIVFSDGEPDNENQYEEVLIHKIPVDTVFISSGSEYREERALAFMQKLARDTGGIFLHFDRAKSNFRTAFKYLSPGLRYMLADRSFVNKLEGK